MIYSKSLQITDSDKKLKLINKILKEIFWNDYQYTAESILDKLSNHDKTFILFFIEKIIKNADFPSQILLKLFSEKELKNYLSEIPRPNQTYFAVRYDRVIYNLLHKGHPRGIAWR